MILDQACFYLEESVSLEDFVQHLDFSLHGRLTVMIRTADGILMIVTLEIETAVPDMITTVEMIVNASGGDQLAWLPQ